MKNQTEWYAVRLYNTRKESWQIVNQDGELIAQFERKEDCLFAVKLFNEKKKTDGTFNFSN